MASRSYVSQQEYNFYLEERETDPSGGVFNGMFQLADGCPSAAHVALRNAVRLDDVRPDATGIFVVKFTILVADGDQSGNYTGVLEDGVFREPPAKLYYETEDCTLNVTSGYFYGPQHAGNEVTGSVEELLDQVALEEMMLVGV